MKPYGCRFGGVNLLRLGECEVWRSCRRGISFSTKTAGSSGLGDFEGQPFPFVFWPLRRDASLKKIVVVAGTRPEAIKLAPVVLEMRRHEEQFTVVFCSTGQHKELFEKALAPFRLLVDREISIMEPNQSLASLTSKALLGVSQVLLIESPDFVVVQGDTVSAMAGALAAAFLEIPVFHVEAGLRTHDPSSPFPEELTRQIIGRIAAVHFAPTELAKANLIGEGVEVDKIVVTGNTVVDALARIEQSVFSNPRESRELKEGLSKEIDFDWEKEKFVLVTMHRRENQGEVIRNLCAALRHSLREDPSIRFVFPVHPNPAIRVLVHNELRDEPNVSLISPLEYPFVPSVVEVVLLRPERQRGYPRGGAVFW